MLGYAFGEAAFSQTSSGSASSGGTITAALPALQAVGTGHSVEGAVGNATLPALQAVGVGQAPIKGTVVAALPALQGVGLAARLAQGAIAAILPALQAEVVIEMAEPCVLLTEWEVCAPRPASGFTRRGVVAGASSWSDGRTSPVTEWAACADMTVGALRDGEPHCGSPDVPEEPTIEVLEPAAAGDFLLVIEQVQAGATMRVTMVGGGGGGTSVQGGGGGGVLDLLIPAVVGTFPVHIGAGGLAGVDGEATTFNGYAGGGGQRGLLVGGIGGASGTPTVHVGGGTGGVAQLDNGAVGGGAGGGAGGVGHGAIHPEFTLTMIGGNGGPGLDTSFGGPSGPYGGGGGGGCTTTGTGSGLAGLGVDGGGNGGYNAPGSPGIDGRGGGGGGGSVGGKGGRGKFRIELNGGEIIAHIVEV